MPIEKIIVNGFSFYNSYIFSYNLIYGTLFAININEQFTTSLGEKL